MEPQPGNEAGEYITPDGADTGDYIIPDKPAGVGRVNGVYLTIYNDRYSSDPIANATTSDTEYLQPIEDGERDTYLEPAIDAEYEQVS